MEHTNSISKTLWAHGTFAFLLAGLITVELYCATLAFHTLSEIDSGFLHLLVWLNAIPVATYLFRKRKQAIGMAVVLGIFIIPHQLYLGHRLLMIQEEGNSIVKFAYAKQEKTGQLPANLNDYKFIHPALQQHFSYSIPTQSLGPMWPHGQCFVVNYYVGTTGTAHWYDSRDKVWDYYPD